MNFKVEMNMKQVQQLVEEKNYSKLQEADQFIRLKNEHPILKNYSEAQLNFDPTYKYIIGSQ